MFGQRLRLARKSRGLTQMELAERLHILMAVQDFDKYETGKKLPSSTRLTALAKSLNVSLDDLLSDRAEALE